MKGSLEERAANRGLRTVSLAGFMEQAALAWAFAVYPLVPLHLVTLLAGHGGAGKSMLMLTWLAHAACGRAWSGFEFKHCRCLYVSLEDPGDLVRYRLKRIVEAYDLDPAALQKAQARVNARVAIGSRSGSWEIAAFGQNLTDKATFTNVNDIPLSPGAFAAFAQEPRTYGLELRTRF